MQIVYFYLQFLFELYNLSLACLVSFDWTFEQWELFIKNIEDLDDNNIVIWQTEILGDR